MNIRSQIGFDAAYNSLVEGDEQLYHPNMDCCLEHFCFLFFDLKNLSLAADPDVHICLLVKSCMQKQCDCLSYWALPFQSFYQSQCLKLTKMKWPTTNTNYPSELTARSHRG